MKHSQKDLSAAFNKWWQQEIAKIKAGERLYFAETIFPGDAKHIFKAGWDAACAIEKEER